MTEVPESVAKLQRELHQIFGPRLQSLIAYGLHRPKAESHASHHATHEAARTQTLAIVETLTVADLKGCAEKTDAWHDAGLATPLLLAAHEFDRSLDAFPLEFGAILADHVVVQGRSPFGGLQVSPVDMRRACEVQARSHLLHLREGFIETRGRGDALSVLIVRSAAPFGALLVSLSRLEGHAVPDPETAGRRAESLLQLTPGAITDVIKLVHVKETPSDNALRVFPAYLNAIERLVAYVDGWGAR